MDNKKEQQKVDKNNTSSLPAEKIESNNDQEKVEGFTEVKNAHASGLGTIGGHEDDVQKPGTGKTADDF